MIWKNPTQPHQGLKILVSAIRFRPSHHFYGSKKQAPLFPSQSASWQKPFIRQRLQKGHERVAVFRAWRFPSML
jgi:hypothetical protein